MSTLVTGFLAASGGSASSEVSRASGAPQCPHPAKTPRIQWVMDENGERVVVLFPCERCGETQHYNVLYKASTCFRCEGVAPSKNDSTAA